jgi:predicted dinucleotide-utilizing enzyme
MSIQQPKRYTLRETTSDLLQGAGAIGQGVGSAARSAATLFEVTEVALEGTKTQVNAWASLQQAKSQVIYEANTSMLEDMLKQLRISLEANDHDAARQIMEDIKAL